MTDEPTRPNEPADDAPEPPPRGVRTMAVVRWAILVLSVLAAAGSWYSYAAAESRAADEVLYQCPMHPEIVSNQPGECPICHMTLEKVEPERAKKPKAKKAAPAPAAAAPSARAQPGQYTCPMHPEIVSDAPGRCPKCNMHLERVEAKPPEPAPAVPSGTTDVELTLDRVQAIGVRTAKVSEGSKAGVIRAPAIVEAPEQTTARVHVRAPGFVEAIAVNQTGVEVRAGQLLFSFYSPEIYQAQSELLATQNWPSLGQSGDMRDSGARRKLELLGVPAKVADKVLADKRPSRTIGIVSPIAGHVTQKNVSLGSFVTPEVTLYEVVDLSKVYVVADLFQLDAASVRVGTHGSFTLTGRQLPPQEATVDLVYPQVNLQSRTTRVRMTVKNRELAVLPGEYGIVEFAGVPGSKSAVIPADALIDTGKQQYVFVERSPGHFSPRLVHVAGEVDGGFELRSGVAPGETVVSGAAFLLDSESRLRASIRQSAETP